MDAVGSPVLGLSYPNPGVVAGYPVPTVTGSNQNCLAEADATVSKAVEVLAPLCRQAGSRGVSVVDTLVSKVKEALAKIVAVPVSGTKVTFDQLRCYPSRYAGGIYQTVEGLVFFLYDTGTDLIAVPVQCQFKETPLGPMVRIQDVRLKGRTVTLAGYPGDRTVTVVVSPPATPRDRATDRSSSVRLSEVIGRSFSTFYAEAYIDGVLY
jgi:hypothetical protein